MQWHNPKPAPEEFGVVMTMLAATAATVAVVGSFIIILLLLPISLVIVAYRQLKKEYHNYMDKPK